MFIYETQLEKDLFLYLWPQPQQPTIQFNIQNLKYGYVQYVFIPEEKMLRILYIFVEPEFRKNGFAIQLIEKLFEEIQKDMIFFRLDEIEIYLDDVSERYGKPNNIYLRFGFQYIYQDENGPSGPEMFKVLKNNFLRK